MAFDLQRLRSLVDFLPGIEIRSAISFLSELGEPGTLAETSAKLDFAHAESGDDIHLEDARRRHGL